MMGNDGKWWEIMDTNVDTTGTWIEDVWDIHGLMGYEWDII